jgi:hypothetical protein
MLLHEHVRLSQGLQAVCRVAEVGTAVRQRGAIVTDGVSLLLTTKPYWYSIN